MRPAPGRLVFVPETGRPLAAEGEVVMLSPFWRRRLIDGDIVRVPPPVAEWTDLPLDPEAPVEEQPIDDLPMHLDDLPMHLDDLPMHLDDLPLPADEAVSPMSPPIDEDLPAEPASACEDP